MERAAELTSQLQYYQGAQQQLLGELQQGLAHVTQVGATA
jgi:hypothetical protein